jgi:hypothetical protein
MFQLHKAGLLSLAGLTVVLFAVQAQDRNGTFSCQSMDDQRQFCRMDVSRGVQMIRQLGDVGCTEGQTWGRQDDGVWVDRGCRAEFALPPAGPQMTRIEPGTVIPVRTTDRITTDRADGRIFTGSVDQDVMGSNGQLAIPRGSNVELIVRVAHDDDLILDLESVTVNGQRYAVDAGADHVDAKDSVGNNKRTGKFVGGGAVLGAILGAAAGGGKGAAIGAGVGAAAGAGAEIATSGREVKIPSESIVTFRMDRPLMVGVPDDGHDRDGNHYHD